LVPHSGQTPLVMAVSSPKFSQPRKIYWARNAPRETRTEEALAGVGSLGDDYFLGGISVHPFVAVGLLALPRAVRSLRLEARSGNAFLAARQCGFHWETHRRASGKSPHRYDRRDTWPRPIRSLTCSF
jgi:hypothetical protein